MANKKKVDTGSVSQAELDKLLKKTEAKSEILTQNDLDKLFKDLNTPYKKDIRYDFKRPMKYSKELMNTLGLQSENLSRIITTTFSMKRKIYTQLHFATVNQLTLEEMLRSIPIPSFVYDVKTSIGQFVIDFDAISGRALMKQYTDLAVNPYIDELDLKYLKEGYISDFVKNYVSILSEKNEIEILDIKHTSNPQKICGSYSEMAVLTTLNIQIGEGNNGLITIFHSAEVVKNLSKMYFSENDSKLQYAKLIGEIELPDNTFVEIARCKAIKIEDLQIGKMIVLPKLESDLVEVVRDNTVLWKAIPINIEENFGVKLTEKLETPITYNQDEYMAVRLGTKYLSEEDFEKLKKNETIALTSKTSQLSEIILTDKTVAFGEIKIVDENFAIQIQKLV